MRRLVGAFADAHTTSLEISYRGPFLLLFCRKLLAIILCCISIPVIVILACVCVCVRRRRRRLAERQARNCEVAARDLTTLFILSSLRQQHDTQTGRQQPIVCFLLLNDASTLVGRLLQTVLN